MNKKRRFRGGEIPTSSMADIAFLLLIFFLVTTTIDTDKGLGIVLPPPGDMEIEIRKESKIFKDIKDKSHMYFVHSYEFTHEDKSVISATTDYSTKIVCAVETENLFGTQFHPEKSDKIGLKIIENFLKL